nr:hypothetical protein [Tanacetum cinerariifolium]
MANNPKKIASGSITQLTRVIADGISMAVPRVMANGGDRFGSQILVNDSMGSGIMANGFCKSVTTNGVSESVAQGIGIRVRDNAVGVSVSHIMGIGGSVVANGVSEPIHGDMVNGVRANVVSESVHHGIGDVVMANGVSEPIHGDMVNGVRANVVSESVHHGIGDVVMANGVREPIRRAMGLREYRSIARGLRVVVRRRRERIRQLELLGNCQDVAATIRFWEQMQLKDVEKGLVVTVLDRRAVVEDSNLVRDIDGLCAGLTARIEEREYFIDELDVLVDRSMGEDYRLASELNRVATEVNGVTMQRERFLEELDSHGETQLNASKKNLFIEKLQGTDIADQCLHVTSCDVRVVASLTVEEGDSNGICRIGTAAAGVAAKFMIVKCFGSSFLVIIGCFFFVPFSR